ncbi:MAG: hypothetical protein F6J93_36725 [Oscillatoria sp. SIO1A7]|nr:hypothetical protein [Oscillatoria sp. SIO1A7]
MLSQRVHQAYLPLHLPQTDDPRSLHQTLQTKLYSVSQISVINDRVGATASPLTVWAVEREFSYWDATPVASHIKSEKRSKSS